MSKEVFRFGAERVETASRIIPGLMYADDRGVLARVANYRDGVIHLSWVCSGRQSICTEDRFCKRFRLYGNGHK